MDRLWSTLSACFYMDTGNFLSLRSEYKLQVDEYLAVEVIYSENLKRRNEFLEQYLCAMLRIVYISSFLVFKGSFLSTR